MKTTITFCFCIITLFAFGFANAAIFKCVAPSGQVIYSNVMGEGCVKLELEWEKIGESATAIEYFDPDTIRRNGDKVKFWSLSDYKTVQRALGVAPFLSSKAQDEFDCKEEQVRTLAYVLYFGNMGGGEAVNSNFDPQKWRAVPPKTLAKGKWDIACGIK